MRADIENLVNSVEKSLELLRQRMDWDTASNRLEEFNARVEDPNLWDCLLYTSPSPRDYAASRMPSSA